MNAGSVNDVSSTSQVQTAPGQPTIVGYLNEADIIHRALHGVSAPSLLCLDYQAALGVLPLLPNPVSGSWLMHRPRFLAGAEFALRLTRGRNGLTQRFHIIFYLSEVERTLQPRFSRLQIQRPGGFWDLFVAGFCGFCYLVLGLWLIRKIPRA